MPIRILIIVSDTSSTKMNLEHYFSNWEKFQIVGSTTSGLDGIKIAKEANPHVVFINTGVENIQKSLDVLREIKASCPDSKIVFISISNNLELLEQALRLGANNFLSQPLEETETVEMVYRVLQMNKGSDLS